WCETSWISECCFFFSSRRRHTRSKRDWSSDVCSSDLQQYLELAAADTEALVTALEQAVPDADARVMPGGAVRLPHHADQAEQVRSEERRVGQGCREPWGQESEVKEKRNGKKI